MKMSPPWGYGVFEAGIAVVERDLAIERLVELHFCAREAETPVLGRNLEAASLPLHHVVIADGPFVNEGADAPEIVGGGTPSFGGLRAGYGRSGGYSRR